MSKNGCHNRPPLRETVLVQSGWIDGLPPHDGSLITKYPRMIEIPDPLSKHCQYQRDKKDDPKCDNCIWKDVPIKGGEKCSKQ